MDKILEPEGVNILVVQGIRTYLEQDGYFAIGRTLPGKRVTDARGGHSAHNFGYAIDLCPEDLEGHPDWNIKHPTWQRMLAVGLQVGLAEGCAWRTFPDNPHFYLKECPAEPTDAMRSIMLEKGLDGVWATFNIPTDSESA